MDAMGSWGEDPELNSGDPDSEDGLIQPFDGVAHCTADAVSADTIGGLESDPHSNLWWYSDGSLWDLGPADLDSTGDGVADSLTSDVGGSMAVLTDSTGDGRIDQLTVLHDDGRVVRTTFDGSGDGWSPTTLGRLD